MSYGMANTGGFGQSSGANLAKGDKLRQMPNFTPEQMDLFKSMFSQVSPDSFTAKLAGGDQATFDQIEAPAMQQFAGMQGNLASRFSGMGSGARRSSGFQNASNAAASGFAQQLQSNRVGLQQKAIQDLMSMSSDLLGQKPYENYVERKPKSFWEQILSGIGENAGSLPGMFAKMFMGGGF